MKYDIELYTNSGFSEGDTEIENYKEKVTKCRKEHKCSTCQSEIKVGDNALRETGFIDGKPMQCYTCLQCIEEWLEESGQVDLDVQDDKYL